MQWYVSVTIDPHPLAPAALLLQELRGWLPQSVGTDDGLTRPAVVVGVVGVVAMSWALALVARQIAPGLGDAIMAAIMVISFLLAVVCADRSRTGLGAYQIARDVLAPIQRAALARPLGSRLTDVLGLPAIAVLSLVAARWEPSPPPPDLPACGIALTPRLAPIPVRFPSA
jgi:hypothetical protein